MSTNEKRPRYDAWLYWNLGFKCNLGCEYCNASDPGQILKKIYYLGILNSVNILWRNSLNSIKQIFLTKSIAEFKVVRAKLTPREIPGINISLLMQALDETNKTFQITFTGGEPFFVSNFTEACGQITKKHYIGVHSNLTMSKIRYFSDTIDPGRVLFIQGSLHIKELERFNLLNKYIENFLLLKKRGFHITASPVAYPPLVSEVDKYRLFFEKRGIKIRFEIFQGMYKGRQYPLNYSDFEIKMFGLGETLKFQDEDIRGCFQRMFCQRGKICNAGYNVGVVFPSGDIQPCFAIGKNMGNVYAKIKFEESLIKCPYRYCSCPLNVYDPYLFQQALGNATH